VGSEKGENKMSRSKAVDATPGASNTVGPYLVYSAGGLFTQHELATNVLIKEAVWRLSGGRFRLLLPQSRELQVLDRPDVDAYIRNEDLVWVVGADIILARFDGVELDSGTVVEFAVAKSLGKPAVILRCDWRGLSGTGRTDPYNLMLKNWPRTVEVHLDSFTLWAGLLAEERQAAGSGDTFEGALETELGVLDKSVDEMARRVIAGLEAVMALKSPYPPEYQEKVYEAFRFCPGSGFDEWLTAGELGEIIQRLKRNGTL
jgi:nucleoside 2-deoxyribosyltransferase